jgi:hypothetical protein
MDKLVKDVFNDVCSGLDINQNFLKRLNAFQVGFLSKNDEHATFFGGHLLGVQRVRFTTTDNNKWFDEILQADEVELTERIHAVPGINPDYNVSSDVFNLSCFWLAHVIWNSHKLSEKQKEAGMIDVMLVLNYRYITSRIVRHFIYPAEESVAEATYAVLSNKFAIKQYGTWYNVLYNRACDIVKHDGKKFSVISRMDKDEDLVAVVNDSQGRVRDMVKNIYTVFRDVHRSGVKITSSSDVVEFDGSSVLKDRVKGLANYKQYIFSILGDQSSFIKDELVATIENIVHTMPPKLFRQTLIWLSEEFSKQKNSQAVYEFVDETLTHSFAYLSDHVSLVRNSVKLPGLLGQIKGVYTSSRSTEEQLLKIRENAEKLVTQATGNKNKNTIASVRTGIMLYVVARTYTKSHYG